MSWGDAEHARLLERLWRAWVPDAGFPGRRSAAWQRLGFQGDAPETDFRGTGLLGLVCCLHVGERHPEVAHELLSSQADAIEHHYPVCAAIINVVAAVTALLKPAHAVETQPLFQLCVRAPPNTDAVQEASEGDRSLRRTPPALTRGRARRLRRPSSNASTARGSGKRPRTLRSRVFCEEVCLPRAARHPRPRAPARSAGTGKIHCISMRGARAQPPSTCSAASRATPCRSRSSSSGCRTTPPRHSASRARARESSLGEPRAPR